MRSGALALAIALAPALAAGPAPAAPSGGGPPGAASCSSCHAPVTPADGSAVPPIHGRPAAEIAAAMAAYRAGERPATIMDRLAKGFSDAETRAIAEWLSGWKP